MDINIDTYEMKLIYNRIAGNVSQFMSVFSKMKTDLELHSSWSGVDSETFRNRATVLCSQISALIDDVEKEGAQIISHANKYEEANQLSLNKLN